ncbi:hypothetical protein [Parafilimonas sp.]|uniref:hypothetical protein n=1 Tax=Parafilimonas sp. TaxID=1969739 RepID=UPI003F7D2B7B
MNALEATVAAQRSTSIKHKPSRLFFILFPAVSMLLGWGLRGFIGGGPYGAMIPGAMVMIAICMLLDVPLLFAAIAVVFGTAGTAMGGEMTYGQTIGFLRDTDTVWWGFTGTSVKGGVWGLSSGLFIGLGLVHERIKVKTIITGFLIFLIGFVIGLKLINDPKIIYFSDPFNQPRKESWAGLLFASAGLLIYLRTKITAMDFRIILHFVWYGLLGGALGFGFGSLWITVGAKYGARLLVVDWWKMMEFSFGFLLGGFLGFAAWKCRNINAGTYPKMETKISKSFFIELIAALFIGVFIYVVMQLFESYLETINGRNGIFYASIATTGRVLTSYLFIGCMLILIALCWPYLGFQIAVTLTFCHCMIDLVTDDRLFPGLQSLPLFFIITTVPSFIVSVLVALFQRKPFVLQSMFLILVWSTTAVAVIRMIAGGEFIFNSQHSLSQVIIGDLFVFNVFIISAILVSGMVVKNKAIGVREVV